MPKIKTSELSGAALNWAVAKCEGYANPIAFYPSTEWIEGGPIIEREAISIFCFGKQWGAAISICEDTYDQDGELVRVAVYEKDWQKCTNIFLAQTSLQAAMRCYVASKLGDEVDVPDELQ